MANLKFHLNAFKNKQTSINIDSVKMAKSIRHDYGLEFVGLLR